MAAFREEATGMAAFREEATGMAAFGEEAAGMAAVTSYLARRWRAARRSFWTLGSTPSAWAFFRAFSAAAF